MSLRPTRRYDEFVYDGVERSLQDFVGDSSATRVLEVDCGTGHWLALLGSYGFPVAGLDPSRQMLQRAKSRVPNATLKQGHAEQIPWGDARLWKLNTYHCGLPVVKQWNEGNLTRRSRLS